MSKISVKKKSGFTLIELLVVIAIIGILATIVLVAMGGARAQARDARRQADIRQIVSAQEMYYGANDEYYPSTSTPTAIGTYMPAVPKDPGTGNPVYGWLDNTTSSSVTKDGTLDYNQSFCVWVASEVKKTPSDTIPVLMPEFSSSPLYPPALIIVILNLC